MNKNIENTVILDCTLRDGGYYVDWDFEESIVEKYLSAVKIANIDIIEIGFRFLPSSKFLGPFAYSTDEYLRTIGLPENIPIAVMVNVSELLNNKEYTARELVNQLFTEKSKSPISIVRVAVHIKDINDSYEIVDELRILGYRVFINLMQIDSVDINQINKIASLIEDWGFIEVLYFADSLGCMDPNWVEKIVNSLSISWPGFLGIHAHNNMGLALPNTLKAQKCGVKYLDSTICGMGRGAGNTNTEYLVSEITRQDISSKYFPEALFPLVLQEFGDLKQKYKWGESAYYFLSATHGIHPTYIQEMLNGDLYDTGQILSTVNFLKKSSVSFFSSEKMLTALTGSEGNSSGSWSASGWAENKDVLILASGSRLKEHIKEITRYIKHKNPVVLCLNINEFIPESIVTAYVACHDTRILIESDRYNSLNIPVILPLDRIPASIAELMDKVTIFDFGMAIKEGKFKVSDTGCTLSSPLSLFYAISVAIAGNANQILLAGADGYEPGDHRYKKVSLLFDQYRTIENSIPLCAITKTTYPIEQRSVYDPTL